MRTCVIFNPTARGDKARRLRDHLDEIGRQCTLMMTTRAGAARLLAAEAAADNYEVIVAAGGDGTVNEVLNGIGDAGRFDSVRLGVLPTGTVNVFAREAGIPLQLHNAWETICKGHEILIDLPELQFTKSAEQQERRYFIQMAGSGWDARAVEMVSWPLKKRIGQFAYIVAGLQAMRGPHTPIAVCHEGKRTEGELVIMGNGRFYGGSFSVFHQANLQDGLLDVCVFPRVNWMILFQYFTSYLLNRRPHIRNQIYFQAPMVEMDGASSIPVQVDGETAGRLPARCIVRRCALRIVAPPRTTDSMLSRL